MVLFFKTVLVGFPHPYLIEKVINVLFSSIWTEFLIGHFIIQ